MEPCVHRLKKRTSSVSILPISLSMSSLPCSQRSLASSASCPSSPRQSGEEDSLQPPILQAKTGRKNCHGCKQALRKKRRRCGMCGEVFCNRCVCTKANYPPWFKYEKAMGTCPPCFPRLILLRSRPDCTLLSDLQQDLSSIYRRLITAPREGIVLFFSFSRSSPSSS